jgi:general secretion pathway protein K
MKRSESKPGGVAVVSVMALVLVVAVLASAVVWRSGLSISRVENQRDIAQARWIARAAIDYARWALVADSIGVNPATTPLMDHLFEPWAQPIPMTSMDKLFDPSTSAIAVDDLRIAGFAGQIIDAQSRFNLARVAGVGTLDTREQKKCETLLRLSGLRDNQVAAFWAAFEGAVRERQQRSSTGVRPLSTDRAFVELLAELDISNEQRQTLRRVLAWLPRPTAINVNTASIDVISALLEDPDRAAARRLIETRDRVPFRDLGEVNSVIMGKITISSNDLDVKSDFFMATGIARFGRLEIGFEALLARQGRQVSLVSYAEN